MAPGWLPALGRYHYVEGYRTTDAEEAVTPTDVQPEMLRRFKVYCSEAEMLGAITEGERNGR